MPYYFLWPRTPVPPVIILMNPEKFKSPVHKCIEKPILVTNYITSVIKSSEGLFDWKKNANIHTNLVLKYVYVCVCVCLCVRMCTSPGTYMLMFKHIMPGGEHRTLYVGDMAVSSTFRGSGTRKGQHTRRYLN